MQALMTEELLVHIDQGSPLYLIVDINQYQEPLALLKLMEGMESLPLFRGTAYKELIPYSPKLIKLTCHSQDLVGDVLQRLSGCVVASQQSIEQLNQTLGEMLLAEHETQGKIFMRFFAPAMARTILQSSHLTHCWRHCPQVWLPDYQGQGWVAFERPEYDLPATFQITQKDEKTTQAEHIAYLLAKTNAWKGLPSDVLKLAAQSLVRMNAYEPLSAKKMHQWSEWLAINTSIMTEPSWLSLLNNPISNNEKWQNAQALVSQSAEITHV